MISVANKDSEHAHATTAAAPANNAETRTETVPLAPTRPPHPYKKWFLLIGIMVVIAGATYFLVPFVSTALNTVSTDDAYVNGDVTYVAPRVSGQVAKVLVADNNVVRKGELLLELDSEPYEVQVNIAQAAVDAAKAELITTQAQVCGIEAQAAACNSAWCTRSRKFTIKPRNCGHLLQVSIRRRRLWHGQPRTTSGRWPFGKLMKERSVRRMSIDIKRRIEQRLRKSARPSNTCIKFVSAWDCQQRRNPRTNLPKYRLT